MSDVLPTFRDDFPQPIDGRNDMNMFDSFTGHSPGELPHESKSRSSDWPLKDIAGSLVECAVLAYKPREAVVAKLKGSCEEIVWFESVGRSFDTQAFGCVLEHDLLIAFRGTKELRDFLTDLLVKTSPLHDFSGEAEIKGVEVHEGFRRALEAIWSPDTKEHRESTLQSEETIREFLKEYGTGKRIWLTGHSLGGALATIAAAKIALSEELPFRESVAGLVTIGSPRVFKKPGAAALAGALHEEQICRIFRSMDPVPAVPYRPFKHVSGRRAFVDRRGKLVIGGTSRARTADTIASILRATENAVGSALPGQHRGLGAFVSDHDSEDYLEAVKGWEAGNTMRLRDSIGPITVPLLKLGIPAGAGGGTLVSFVQSFF